MNDALIAVLARASEIAADDLPAQLQWIEDASIAADGAEELGPRGKRAATDLRAALGAILLWAQQGKDPSQWIAVEAAMKMYLARAQHTLYGALEDAFQTLAKSAPPEERTRCAAAARAFGRLRDAIGRGETPPKDAIERLKALSR